MLPRPIVIAPLVGLVSILVGCNRESKTSRDELPPLATRPAAAPTVKDLSHFHQVVGDCVYDLDVPAALADAHTSDDPAVHRVFEGHGYQLTLHGPGRRLRLGLELSNFKERLPAVARPGVELWVGRNGMGAAVCAGREATADPACDFSVEADASVEGDAIAMCQSATISRAH